MAGKSLNRAQLIGNLTRDPELRYTPSGAAVVSFGIATNRSWTTDTGEKHDEPEFHNIVAWNKLAEICSQFLTKGQKVFVEGRMATRKWTGKDGQERSTTEIVIDDMIMLGTKGPGARVDEEEGASQAPAIVPTKAKTTKKEEPEKQVKSEEPTTDEVPPDDIPF